MHMEATTPPNYSELHIYIVMKLRKEIHGFSFVFRLDFSIELISY